MPGCFLAAEAGKEPRWHSASPSSGARLVSLSTNVAASIRDPRRRVAAASAAPSPCCFQLQLLLVAGVGHLPLVKALVTVTYY